MYITDKEHNNIWKNIYKSTQENYLEEIEPFTDECLEQCKINPNVSHNIPYEKKNENNYF